MTKESEIDLTNIENILIPRAESGDKKVQVELGRVLSYRDNQYYDFYEYIYWLKNAAEQI